jgi:ABC-type proline/glycine betaine transport system substrate-binding protein
MGPDEGSKSDWDMWKDGLQEVVVKKAWNKKKKRKSVLFGGTRFLGGGWNHWCIPPKCPDPARSLPMNTGSMPTWQNSGWLLNGASAKLCNCFSFAT